MLRKNRIILLSLLLCMITGFKEVHAREMTNYREPSQKIKDLVESPWTPSIKVSPDGRYALLLEVQKFKTIKELAGPEHRIGGLRVDPLTNGPSRTTYHETIRLLSIQKKKEIQLMNLPEQVKISNVRWSPDGKKAAMLITEKKGIELWVLDVTKGKFKRLTGAVVNDAYYRYPYRWMPGSKGILYKSIVRGRGAPPEEPEVPEGPVVQESKGTEAPVRTYQDLIDNPYEEELFEYYLTSELKIVDLKGNIDGALDSSMVINFEPSPDGNYILVESITRPFSYIVPAYRFPRRISIIDRQGKEVRNIADIPLAENIPVSFDAVREGAREFNWRADVPATLYWVEAMDKGNPKNDVEVRDRLFYLEAPFNGEPRKSIPFSLRFGSILWGKDDLAVAKEYWWNTRREIMSFFNPQKPEDSKKVIFDRSWEDRYNDPGDFLAVQNKNGKDVLLMSQDGKYLYLSGSGASPEGNRPFLDRFEIKTNNTDRLWRSEAPYYEMPIKFISPKNGLLLTGRESKDEPPNYFLRDLRNDTIKPLTDFPHPYPELKDISVKLLRYERKDGVQLTAKLYLPPGYSKEEKRLPVLMWAYPISYQSAAAAGQVRDSPHRFMRIGWWSPQVFLIKGYAVLDNASMPVIAEEGGEPNDTYVEQLVEDARAAVEKITRMGVADSNSVAIGGHSYGAFMAANLLAHSDIFSAGIARSGAYNRTLTPFGFQREQRTLWEATDVYIKMSPFMFADSVNEPLLLIHGEEDNNSGTYPLQSRRFYHALKGHGATARLVMLPHESHWYRARESVMHQLWEMENWLTKYVK